MLGKLSEITYENTQKPAHDNHMMNGGGVCYYLTEWILAILAYTQSGYFTYSWDEDVNNTPTNTAKRSGW